MEQQYKQQNQEEEQNIEIQIPKIKCKVHQNFYVELINLYDNSNPLLCMKCAYQNKIKSDDLIEIEQIFSNNKQLIIKNWPPYLDEGLYTELNRIKNSKNIELIQQIDSIFQDFKRDVCKTIDDQYKILIKYINTVEDQRLSTTEIYNQVSKKEEIRKYIFENQNNYDQLEDYFKNIILIQQDQFKLDKQSLLDSLNSLTKCEEKLQLNYIMNQFEQILQKLKSINFLNNHQPSTSLQNNNIIIQQNSIPIEQQNQKVDILNDSQIIFVEDLLQLNSYEHLSLYKHFSNIQLNLQSSQLHEKLLPLIEQLNHLALVKKLILNLSHNKIDEKGIMPLSQGFKSFTSLTDFSLHLTNNQIGDKGIKFILPLLERFQFFTQLTHLSLILNSTSIGDQGVINLTDTLKQLTQLNQLQLDFQSNKISVNGFQYLVLGIKDLPKLSCLKLYLNSNGIQQQQKVAIQKQLKFKSIEITV